MARVQIDEVAVGLELAVEHGDESAGELAAMNDAIELGEHRNDLEVPLQSHAKSRDDVANQECRGKAVAARIAHRQPEHFGGKGDEIEEIASDLFGRYREAGNV